MNSPEHVLNANEIRLPDYAQGEHATTCPRCSRDRKTAGHRAAKCLSVRIEEGKAFWHCNHCGWSGPNPGDGGGNGGGQPLIAYIYRDKGGAPLFRKVRNKPRDPPFYIQKWDGSGWAKGKEANAKIKVNMDLIYRADEVAKAIADDREILVVEGEKDADRLWSLGFAATCNAHGASEPDRAPKWKRAHSAQLAGASIVVLNDHDPPGIAHAQTICKLSAGVAESVRRVVLADHWHDIGKGDDVSDWLERGGGTRDKLAVLIAAAPVVAPGPSGPDGRKRPTII